MKKTWVDRVSFPHMTRHPDEEGSGLVQRLCDAIRAQGSVFLPPYPSSMAFALMLPE